MAGARVPGLCPVGISLLSLSALPPTPSTLPSGFCRSERPQPSKPGCFSLVYDPQPLLTRLLCSDFPGVDSSSFLDLPKRWVIGQHLGVRCPLIKRLECNVPRGGVQVSRSPASFPPWPLGAPPPPSFQLAGRRGFCVEGPTLIYPGKWKGRHKIQAAGKGPPPWGPRCPLCPVRSVALETLPKTFPGPFFVLRLELAGGPPTSEQQVGKGARWPGLWAPVLSPPSLLSAQLSSSQTEGRSPASEGLCSTPNPREGARQGWGAGGMQSLQISKLLCTGFFSSVKWEQ